MAKNHPPKNLDQPSENPSKDSSEKKKAKTAKTTRSMTLTDQIQIHTDFDDPELNRMMQRIKDIDFDIKDKIRNLCELSGRSAKEVEEFLDDSKNFTEQFIKDTEKKGDELIEKLWGKKIAKIKKLRKTQKESIMTNKRKKKSLGSRKKWIPMD